MRRKNNFKLFKYLGLTFANYTFCLYFFDPNEYFSFSIFIAGIMVNQYLLFVLISDLTGIRKKNGLVPVFLYAPLKLFTLIFCFWYAIVNTQEKEPILVLNYIFQLIILVLSTKRIVKKN